MKVPRRNRRREACYSTKIGRAFTGRGFSSRSNKILSRFRPQRPCPFFASATMLAASLGVARRSMLATSPIRSSALRVLKFRHLTAPVRSCLFCSSFSTHVTPEDDKSATEGAQPSEQRFKYWIPKRQQVTRGPSYRHKSDPTLQEDILPLPHFLFAGRTNVGKSSLISNLVGRKNFARASSVPGKTDAINTFIVNDKFAIADFPGHGQDGTRRTATLNVHRKWNRVWRPLVFKFIDQFKTPNQIAEDSIAGEELPAGVYALFYLCDIKSRVTSEDKDFLASFQKAAPDVPIVLVMTKDDLVKNSWRRYVQCSAICWRFVLHPLTCPLMCCACRRQLQRSICDTLEWTGPILHYTSKQTERCRNHLRRYITTFLEEAESQNKQPTDLDLDSTSTETHEA